LHKALKINDCIFSIIDCEVYYWHSNHPDKYAEGVPHNKPTGELEAHRYGIDLSLGNKKGEEYGGILICGLHEKDKIYDKNMVKNVIFNSLKYGDNKIELVDIPKEWTNYFQSKRLILGQADCSEKVRFVNEKYKFLANHMSLFKTYKGKESIFRHSNLRTADIESLLGYKLTL